MSKYIKNEDNVTHTRQGVPIAAGAYYLIPESKLAKWANDSQVLADIANHILVMAKTDDETTDIDDVAEGINFLKGNLPMQIDNTTPVHTFALAEGHSLRARLIGFISSTIPKGTEETVDWQMPHVSHLGQNKQTYMDGIDYYVKDAEVGDHITFQVVDKDNLLGYGAGFVLDEFGSNWYVMPDAPVTIRLYKAKLIPGMYIRLKYNSVGSTNDPKIVCNLFRHVDTEVDV